MGEGGNDGKGNGGMGYACAQTVAPPNAAPLALGGPPPSPRPHLLALPVPTSLYYTIII